MDRDTKLKALVLEAARDLMTEEPGVFTLKEAKSAVAESMAETLLETYVDCE